MVEGHAASWALASLKCAAFLYVERILEKLRRAVNKKDESL